MTRTLATLTFAALALPAGAQTGGQWVGNRFYDGQGGVMFFADLGGSVTGDADLDAALAACLRHSSSTSTTLTSPPHPVISYAPGFEACPAIQARADAITAQRQADTHRARKAEQDAADAADRALVGKIAGTKP